VGTSTIAVAISTRPSTRDVAGRGIAAGGLTPAHEARQHTRPEQQQDFIHPEDGEHQRGHAKRHQEACLHGRLHQAPDGLDDDGNNDGFDAIE
jgi:hypothetical protein